MQGKSLGRPGAKPPFPDTVRPELPARGRTVRHRVRRLKTRRPVQMDQIRTHYRHQKTQNTSPPEGIWRGNSRKASSAPLRRSLEASSSSTPPPSPSPSHFPLVVFPYLVLDLNKYLFIHLYSIHPFIMMMNSSMCE